MKDNRKSKSGYHELTEAYRKMIEETEEILQRVAEKYGLTADQLKTLYFWLENRLS